MLDLIIIALLCGGLVHGFTTGLIRQVASLLGLVLSFVLALQLMHPVGEWTHAWIGAAESIAPVVGFVIVFFATHVSIVVGARLIEKLVGALQLSFVNRALGAGAGALKVGLGLSVAFLALAQAGFPGEQVRDESAFYHSVASLMPTAWSFFSENVADPSDFTDLFRPRGPGAKPSG